MSLTFGERTGHLDLLDYDVAVARGIGALYDEEKNQWYLPLKDPCSGESIYIKPEGSEAPQIVERAIVIWKQSEPTHTEYDLPAVVIQRDDYTFAEQREWSPTAQYRLPACGAKRVSSGGKLGWDSYETKEKEWPVDLTYTIETWARYRAVAQVLHQMVGFKYPPRTSVKVIDSLNNERVYHAFQEGTADLTEVNTMVDRVSGFSLSLRIEGELTWDRVPQTDTPFLGEVTPRPPDPGGPGNPGEPGGPFDPTDPDPGEGGLYADGQPCKRLTVMERDE